MAVCVSPKDNASTRKGRGGTSSHEPCLNGTISSRVACMCV